MVCHIERAYQFENRLKKTRKNNHKNLSFIKYVFRRQIMLINKTLEMISLREK